MLPCNSAEGKRFVPCGGILKHLEDSMSVSCRSTCTMFFFALNQPKSSFAKHLPSWSPGSAGHLLSAADSSSCTSLQLTAARCTSEAHLRQKLYSTVLTRSDSKQFSKSGRSSACRREGGRLVRNFFWPKPTRLYQRPIKIRGKTSRNQSL